MRPAQRCLRGRRSLFCIHSIGVNVAYFCSTFLAVSGYTSMRSAGELYCDGYGIHIVLHEVCGSMARAAVVSTSDLTCSVRRTVAILTFVGLCAATCRGAALAAYIAFELTQGPYRPAHAPAVAGAGLAVASHGLSPPSGDGEHSRWLRSALKLLWTRAATRLQAERPYVL